MGAKYLNIGCGSRFNRSWTNVDMHPYDKDVQPCNILHGLPFNNECFDVVYHSHVLEHIRKSDVDKFLAECFRVLKPNGVLRVVIPDLEQIARLYIKSLNEMDKGNKDWGSNHEWMILELYDQVIRDVPGGEIKKYISASDEKTQTFIKERWGAEAERLIENIKKSNVKSLTKETVNFEQGILGKMSSRLRNNFSNCKKCIAKLCLGQEYERYQNDKLKIEFLNSGELHKWMYDRYSLKKLLLDAGFYDFVVMDASTSNIPDWIHQGLDVDNKGNAYKPDSIFAEVKKPS